MNQKTRIHIILLLVTLLFCICGTAGAQIAGRFRLIPPFSARPGSGIEDNLPRVLRGLNGPGGYYGQQNRDNGQGNGMMGVDGLAGARRSNSGIRGESRKVSPQGMLPTWTDSFKDQGLEFTYTMVGTDPQKGSKTTVIPTEIIPLRFVFPDGTVYDSSTDIVDNGQTAIQRIIASPIFQNYDFVINGTRVGNTQYGDAFQRANFWNSVSTRSPEYHVLLGQPTVLPAQTVIVPPYADISTVDPNTGLVRPRVDDDFLMTTQESIVLQLGVSTKSLPIVVWGPITSQYTAAIHPAVLTPNGQLAYIGTTYKRSTNGFFNFGGDVYPLSHEVVEWMDDPFALTDANFTPGWNFALDGPKPRCDSTWLDYLEVADPLEFYGESSVPLPTTDFTYHVADAVFLDFFTRSAKSRSVNGQYDLFDIRHSGQAVSVAPQCVGDLHPDHQTIDVPGSIATFAFGINNRGDVVGLYGDSNGFLNGFKLSKGTFTTINFPGALATGALNINESGAIVGYFYDPNLNLHGFLYKNGAFQQIDVPGALDTSAFGINSAGDIVGTYDQLQPIPHGFVLHNGRFQSVDSPFGLTLLNGINDLGVLVGSSIDPNVGQSGLIFGRGGFTLENMAGAAATTLSSINNGGMKTGVFIDGNYLYEGGFVNFLGYQHEINWPGVAGFTLLSDVNGNNDLNQIVGSTVRQDPLDPNSFKFVGFVSTLPIAGARH